MEFRIGLSTAVALIVSTLSAAEAPPQRLVSQQAIQAEVPAKTANLANDLALALDIPAGMLISAQQTGGNAVVGGLGGSSRETAILGTGMFNVDSSGTIPVVTAVTPEPGFDLGAVGAADDEASLTVQLSLPPNISRIGFSYEFLTTEYPEWLSVAGFEDEFSVTVSDASGTREALVITPPFLGPITSGGTGFEVFADDPVGELGTPSGFLPDASTTGWQSVILPVSGPTVTLTFTVRDVGDGDWDSAVQIDGFSVPEFEVVDVYPDLFHSPFSPNLVTPLSDRLISLGGPCRGVAADGESRCVLRTQVPGPGTVTFRLVGSAPLDGGLDSGSDAMDRDLEVTVNASFVDFSMSGIPITGWWAFAVYRAPDNFPGSATDLNKLVALRSTFNPSDGGTAIVHEVPLFIQRPPVVLIHGLWGAPHETFSFPLVDDPRFRAQMVLADYSSTHAHRFQDNVPRVREAIHLALSDARSAGTAATQVDIVAHSMGGLLSRLYATQSWYKHHHTYWQGSINRLITLDTPHTGSPLGDIVVGLRNRSWRFTAAMEAAGFPVVNGGLDDLSYHSGAIDALPQSELPAHTIVGLSGTAPVLADYRLTMLYAMLAFFLESVVFEEEHDFIVGESSQRGGMGGFKTDTVEGVDGVHLNNGGSPIYSNKVIDLLNSNVNGVNFGQLPPPATVPGPTYSYPPPSSTGSYGNCLLITSPSPNTSVAAGSTIQVSVEDTTFDRTTSVLVVGDRVWGTDDSPPFDVAVDIPMDYLGDLSLTVFGLDDNNNFTQSSELGLHVTTSAQLLDVEVAAPTILFDDATDTRNVAVVGMFDDGVTRDLSDPSTGTIYGTASTEVASVTSSGEVSVNGPGDTAVVVQNTGMQEGIDVRVRRCDVDADCDDGSFCTGTETCGVGGMCVRGTDPCPNQLCDELDRLCDACVDQADCDDGNYCNGAESCVGGFCSSSAPPCGTDPCVEADQSCLCVTPPSFGGIATLQDGSFATCRTELSWASASSSCGNSVVYNVYRSTTPGFTPDAANLRVACLADTEWSDTDVLPGTTYHYIVRAEDDTSNGDGPCNQGNAEGNTSLLGVQPLGCSATSPPSTPLGVSQNVATATDGLRAVSLGDLDRDGDPDFVFTSAFDDTIAWSENLGGNSGYGSPTTIDASFAEASDVELADVDGDGDLDVVGAAPGSSTVGWFENSGTAVFGPLQVVSSSSNGAGRLALGDVDGDGDVDVVGASKSNDTIDWYENLDGLGSFGPAISISSDADGVTDLTMADLDRDGDLDIVSVSFFDGQVTAHLNSDGSGTTWTTTPVGVNLGGEGVAAGDVDNDGDADIVSTSALTKSVVLYENPDFFTGPLPGQLVHSSAEGVRSVRLVDIDRDGDLDIATAWITGPAPVAWFENTDGAGNFGPPQQLSVGQAGAVDLDVGDTDGDGDLDIVAPGGFDQSVRVYGNETIHRSAWFQGQNVVATTADSVLHTISADVDGDGDQDLVSAGDADDQLVWFENLNGAGTFGAAQLISTAGVSSCDVHADDLDDDGDLDILSCSRVDQTIWWHEQTPGINWTTHTVSTGLAVNTVSAADVDRDGDSDLLWATFAGTVGWSSNLDGNGNFGADQIISSAATIARTITAADIDGNGDLDVVVASDAEDRVFWFENDAGDGTSWTERIVTTSVDGPVSSWVADMDHDGDLDVLSASFWDDKIAVHLNTNGDGTTWSEQVISTSVTGGAFVSAGDLDADGDLDVMATSYSDNEVLWFENLGSGTFGSERILSSSAMLARSAHGVDLDRDGDLDIVAASEGNDRIVWYENRGGQFSISGSSTAQATIAEGSTSDVLEIVVTHNGRLGDSGLEVTRLELLFEDQPGVPLTSNEASGLIETLLVFVDDGSGQFEAAIDPELARVESLVLVNGVQTVLFPDGDPNGGIGFGQPGRLYVVLQMTNDAAIQSTTNLEVTLLGELSAAENRDFDTPLSLEPAVDSSSGVISVVSSAGRVPDGFSVAGTALMLERAAGDDLRLSWGASCTSGGSDFAIYEGDIGEFQVHEQKICGTSGATEKIITPGTMSHYYLIVPLGIDHEGSYGRDSEGNERPPGAPQCMTQQTGGCS